MNPYALVYEAVVQLSNRPDVPREIEAAIDAAVLSYHHLRYFWRDKVEGVINSSGGRRVELDIPLSTFPRLRNVAGIKAFDQHSNCCSAAFKHVKSISECMQCSSYYMLMGKTLRIKSNTASAQFIITYYQNPIQNPKTVYDSWVLELYPNAVIDAALRNLYLALHDSARAAGYNALVGGVGSQSQHTGHCRTIITEQLESDVRGY